MHAPRGDRVVEPARGIVTAADLARMKPTALLVDTSRAGLVAPGALEAALAPAARGWPRSRCSRRSRCSAGATRWPPWTTRCARPHLGYVERDGLQHMLGTIFDQVLAYAAGSPINVVNPDALGARR